jgi:hypothetical protein
MQALFCTGIAFLPRSMLLVTNIPLAFDCDDDVGVGRVYVPPPGLVTVGLSVVLRKQLSIFESFISCQKINMLWARTCVEPLILLNMYSTKTIHKNINPHYPQGYTSIGDPYSGNNDKLPSRWKEKQFVTQRFPKVSSFSCMQRCGA